MSLKIKGYSKFNVTKNGISPEKECNAKWNVTQMKCPLKLNADQNIMSLKITPH